MDKPQYYALTLDDYATVSFCSFSKFYYGTLDDIIPFMEMMEKENEKPDMIAAFKDFILGNKEVTHAVAYNQQKLLTPVVFHQGVKQTYTDRSWTHKNIYGWPYEMHADRIEVEQAIITHEGKYHRCIKAKFINLAYENDLAEEDGVYTPIGKFWGHPNVFKKDWRDEKNRIIESRFFVSEDNYDTYKDAQEHMDEKYISFDCLMEDVFGDG